MSSRCTGHCCQAFTLSESYDYLKAHAGNVTDGIQIATMVIPLGKWSYNPITFREYNEPLELFTCKNLVNHRDCAIYEDRPAMCRTYPDSGTCEYPCCTKEKEDVNTKSIQKKVRNTKRDRNN